MNDILTRMSPPTAAQALSNYHALAAGRPDGAVSERAH
jgi:hypothetical protein